MHHTGFKIGYSDTGGVYMGKNTQADYHMHHAITIILSLGEPFEISFNNKDSEPYKAAIIQKDVCYSLKSCKTDYVIYIHLDPYSEIGIKLAQKGNPIQKLEIEPFSGILQEFRQWFNSSKNDEAHTAQLLNKASTIIAMKNNSLVKIDDRIQKSIQLIKQSDTNKLLIREVAKSVNLSPSHFARLFKKETGMPFRKFVLHCKLVKSLKAIYQQHSLAESSYLGGFSDQPHLTRTFKKAFGIKPSASLK